MKTGKNDCEIYQVCKELKKYIEYGEPAERSYFTAPGIIRQAGERQIFRLKTCHDPGKRQIFRQKTGHDPGKRRDRKRRRIGSFSVRQLSGGSEDLAVRDTSVAGRQIFGRQRKDVFTSETGSDRADDIVVVADTA